MIQDCKNEIEGLHSFFEQWFNGIIKPTEINFSRLQRALATDFHLITPSGQLMTKKEVLAVIEEAYATNKDNPIYIWTKDFVFKKINPSLMIVIYQEWHKVNDKDKGRISSAIFRRNSTAPNNVEWLHLQESWLVRPKIST